MAAKADRGAEQTPSSGTNTKKAGDAGEDLACDYLRSKGLVVIERNWRSGRYEIDIICQKNDRLVFVEVKTRKTRFVDPVLAVDKAKRARIIRAADTYLRGKGLPFEYQFDIITVTDPEHGGEIEHIEDAFFPSP